MGSSVSPTDEIWFLRVCHHISNAVYLFHRDLLAFSASPQPTAALCTPIQQSTIIGGRTAENGCVFVKYKPREETVDDINTIELYGI